MTATERLDSVIQRENVTNQTFEDLEKSLSQGTQEQPKETEVKPNDNPNPPEPQANGTEKVETPVGTEKAGAEGEQDTPTEPSEKKDSEKKPEDKGKQNHTPEEQREYAWQKLKKENKTFRTKNEALTQQIKQLQEQIEAFKSSQGKPNEEEYTRDNFATEEDWLRYVAHKQYQQDTANSVNEQNQRQLEDLQEQQRMLVIAQREEALFPAEKRQEYVQVVSSALEAGMKSALDANPDVMEFIDNSDMGPRLMYHFAMMPQDLIRIANNPNPTSRSVMLAQLEQGLYRHFVLGGGQQNQQPQPNATPNATPSATPSAAPTNPNPAPRNVPVIGKIGEGADKSNPDTLDEKSIISSYRKYTT